jgi:hypothetical protein
MDQRNNEQLKEKFPVEESDGSSHDNTLSKVKKIDMMRSLFRESERARRSQSPPSDVSSQKLGADPLLNTGQECLAESSSETFSPNIEKIPADAPDLKIRESEERASHDSSSSKVRKIDVSHDLLRESKRVRRSKSPQQALNLKIRESEAKSDEQVGDQRELARVNRFLHMKGPTELCDAYWAKRQGPAEKFAAVHGVSVEEYNQMCQERVEKLVEGTQLWMRRKLEILATILESGRVKTFFETGTSDAPLASTEKYLAIRAQTEKQMFGYGPETNLQDRPVYVYLSHSPDGLELHPEQYLDTIVGPVAIRLKDSLRERTSFTLAGSRSANASGTEVNLVPSPLEQPSFCSYFYDKDLLEVHSIEDLPRFAEGQVHGSLLVSDIEEVVFHHGVKPDDKLISLLRKHAIPYRET